MGAFAAYTTDGSAQLLTIGFWLTLAAVALKALNSRDDIIRNDQPNYELQIKSCHHVDSIPSKIQQGEKGEFAKSRQVLMPCRELSQTVCFRSVTYRSTDAHLAAGAVRCPART